MMPSRSRVMVAWAHPEKLRRGDSSGEFISHFQDE
jgi:hypothetical protein